MPGFIEEIVYICEFFVNDRPRSILLRPIDAGNGVIMDQTPDGLMRGITQGGQELKVAVQNILKVERYRISIQTNQGVKSFEMNEKQAEANLDARTDRNTGEVKGIAAFKDKARPDKKFERE